MSGGWGMDWVGVNVWGVGGSVIQQRVVGVEGGHPMVRGGQGGWIGVEGVLRMTRLRWERGHPSAQAVRRPLDDRSDGPMHRLFYTEKATPARQRPERQHNARSNRRKQCSPNETKSYANPTPPRKRQHTPTNGYTPRRMTPTHTRLTYTRMRPHAPSHQAGDHPVPAHTASFVYYASL